MKALSNVLSSVLSERTRGFRGGCTVLAGARERNVGLPARVGGCCLVLCLCACHGGDSGADGWFDTGRIDAETAQFSADVATVYGLSVPPRWCRHVAAVAASVFAGEWELAELVPHSPLNCALPLALPGEPQVQVELAPYFVFERALADEGGDTGLRVGGEPAFFPDAFSVSVAVHQRMMLMVSMAEVAAAAATKSSSEYPWQAQAVRLAEALLSDLRPAGAPPETPKSRSGD